MDTATPEGRIIATLKQEYRAKGLHYRDVAMRLKVSEGTVKRYFTGRGVSLTVLRQLADIADLDLLSLAALAEEKNTGERKLTSVQQAVLGKNKVLSAVFFMLWHGWTPAEINKEFEIGESLETALIKLESLGLIRRMTHGVKILATPSLDHGGGGQLTDLTRDSAREFLSELNLRDPHCEWTSYSTRLSPASVLRLQELIKKFVEDTRALMISDHTLPRDKVQWYHVFFAAQPISRKKILRRN